MSKKNLFLLVSVILILVIIAGTAIYAISLGSSNANSSDNKDSEMTMEESSSRSDDAMMEKEEEALEKNDEIMEDESGAYLDYSEQNLATAQSAGDRTVIFFAASWCPSCRDQDVALTASKDKIPAGVTILKADYDDEVSLRQKYGVTTQHTFVQVDASGNEVNQWTSLYGDTSLESVLSNLKA